MLFQPGHIGELELRNRIVMAPMGTNYAAEDGHITERIKDYYEERAKGGVGLIIVGVGSIDHPRGSIIPCQVGISDDKFIPGLRRLVLAVRQHSAKIAIQLNHGGKLSRQNFAEGCASVTPSPASTLMTEIVTGLTKREITNLAVQYATKMPEGRLPQDRLNPFVTRRSTSSALFSGSNGNLSISQPTKLKASSVHRSWVGRSPARIEPALKDQFGWCPQRLPALPHL